MHFPQIFDSECIWNVEYVRVKAKLTDDQARKHRVNLYVVYGQTTVRF